MILKVFGAGSARNISQLVTSRKWSGDLKQCARELEFTLLTSQTDPLVPVADIPLWSPVGYYDDDGAPAFLGHVVYRQRPTGANPVFTFRCLDYGRALAGNEGWYKFDGQTPEGAVARICADHGIEPGEIAVTGVPITWKFPGVALHKIIFTMYSKASETTGKRYVIRFVGKKLCVFEKPERPQFILEPRVNLLDSSITEDGTNVVNSVLIASEDGKVIRTVSNDESVALAGRLQKYLKQSKDDDGSKAAQKLLDDNNIKQTVPATVTGNLGLLTGAAVMVTDSSSGVKGLFWIDEDSHVWQGGKPYQTKLALNFKSIMDSSTAGSEK